MQGKDVSENLCRDVEEGMEPRRINKEAKASVKQVVAVELVKLVED